MTTRTKWALTTVAILFGASALSFAALAKVLYAGASRGAYEWLRGMLVNTVPTYNAELLEQLSSDAQGLKRAPGLAEAVEAGDPAQIANVIAAHWLGREPDEIWLVVMPDGRVLGDRGGCTVAPTRSNSYLWCARQPVMIAQGVPFENGARLYTGLVLDDAYVDALERITSSEVMLVGSAFAGPSSLRDLTGARVTPSIPPALTAAIHAPSTIHFWSTERLAVPNGYHGYLSNSGGPMDLGVTGLDGYLMSGSIDPRDPQSGVELVMLVPREVMDIGPKYSLIIFSVASALVLLVLGTLSWKVTARYAEPLVSLAKTAKQVGGGDPEAQAPVAGDGEVKDLAIAFNLMVRQLKESQAKIIQAEKRAAIGQLEKMAAIGQLAGGVAHEINNPLGVILGFAQGLERRVPEGDPLRMPVQSIVREAVRCRNLVQELLTFSRTAKKHLERLDLNEVVRSSAVLLEARAKMQEVQLVQDLDPSPLVLSANRTQLQQVLVNLGTNALDAMPSGGALTLRARHGEGGVSIEVIDTGSGIPEHVQKRMFEPFFTTKEVGKGTGLGLSLVYEIVQQHKGKLAVDSTIGKGTRIVVQLPVGAAELEPLKGAA